jgi:hypothetical protein
MACWRCCWLLAVAKNLGCTQAEQALDRRQEPIRVQPINFNSGNILPCGGERHEEYLMKSRPADYKSANDDSD